MENTNPTNGTHNLNTTKCWLEKIHARKCQEHRPVLALQRAALQRRECVQSMVYSIYDYVILKIA